jgi:hypothetical protein
MRDKSLTELRGMAQAFGIEGIFSMDKLHLIQAIEAKQLDMMPKPKVDIPKPAYDPRIMSKIPARLATKDYVMELMQPYIARGLKFTFVEPEEWHMKIGVREDSGTMRTRPEIIRKCADRLMNG